MKERLYKILKNKNNIVLLENFGALSILQGLSMVLPLITLPYLLKTIGTDKYGIIIVANSLLVYFQTLTDFSFNLTSVREVSVHRHSKRSLNYIYSRVLTCKALLICISAAIYIPLIFLVPKFYINRVVFFVTFPSLIGYVLLPDWFFQGIQKMKVVTVRTSVIKIISTACVFLFIHEKRDFYIFPLLMTIGYIISGIYAQYLVVTQYGLRYTPIGYRRVSKSLKNNFNVFVNQIFPTLYNNSTTFLLGLLTNNSIVGIYGASKGIIEVANKCIQMISRTFFPHLNRNFGSFEKFKVMMISIGFSSFAVISLLSPFLKSFFHIKGQYTVLTICILALSIPFYAMSQCFGTNYFIVKRKDSMVMKNTVFASLTGFILAFPLILTFAGVGAAVNLTLSRGIMGVGLWWKYKKFKK